MKVQETAGRGASQIARFPAGASAKEASMRALSCNGVLRTTDTDILLYFPRPMRSLSTAIWGGGFRNVRWAANHKLTVFYPTEDAFPGGSVASYLRLALLDAGCDPETSCALLTSARLEWFRYCRKACGALTVETIATGGVEKTAARAGEPAFYEEKDGHFLPVGTINLITLVNGFLPDSIMARALITVTEGKAAALQDLGIASCATGRPATGTATDGITLLTDPHGPCYTDAGTFSRLGEFLASSSYETVRGCLEDFDRPWNRDERLATPGAVSVSELRDRATRRRP